MSTARKIASSPGTVPKPMLATLINAPFDDPDWVFETKWDGFRVIARVAQDRVSLFSRGGVRITRDYPSIAEALETMRRSAVVDGELVALDRRGRSRFQLLQNARRTKTRLRYYIFDLISLDGKSTRTLPLIDRKRLLRKVVPWSNVIRFSRHIARNGVKLFRAARRKGLEGIIAKRAQSHYYPGKRTREWLKIKAVWRQEVVIVGFTKPRKSRKYFGALVLAVRDRGVWRYVGHAGTGFSSASLKSIYTKLAPLVRRKRPFAEPIAHETETAWVKPQLVCEVHFSEWTSDGQMRHPAFVGLRGDKPATKVVREKELHVSTR